MRHLTCDVAVIGAGTAGLAARSAASEAGASTLLIEAGPGGTTCARTGCMPSKLLIAAANAAAGARGLAVFGLAAGPVEVDGAAVMTRLRRERDRFVAGVLEDVASLPEAERLHGRARFLSPNRLAVGEELAIEARAVVVATGSRATVPDDLRPLGHLVLTSESVFELPALPGSLAVIGAGPLGIELALAFARLGVRVAVFDKGGAIGGVGDPEVARAARALLGHELDLKLHSEFEASPTDLGASFTWRTPEGRNGTATFEHVLVATGRTPNLEGLDLDRAGLARGPNSVPVFDPATLRCGDSSIFIAGDADGIRPVLHEASGEGRVAGRNAATFPNVTPVARPAELAITYTDPEIAIVGGGWAAMDPDAIVVGSVDLARSGRARAMGRNAGLIRVYGRKTDGVLLGGEMIGPEAEHLGHLLAFAVHLRLTAERTLTLPFYHPTLEESLRAAIGQIRGELRTRPPGGRGRSDCGPGG